MKVVVGGQSLDGMAQSIWPKDRGRDRGNMQRLRSQPSLQTLLAGWPQAWNKMGLNLSLL